MLTEHIKRIEDNAISMLRMVASFVKVKIDFLLYKYEIIKRNKGTE